MDPTANAHPDLARETVAHAHVKDVMVASVTVVTTVDVTRAAVMPESARNVVRNHHDHKRMTQCKLLCVFQQ